MRIATIGLFVIAAAAGLSAHVTVQPKESAAGASQRYTVRVPTEMDVPTLWIELEIPAGVTVTDVPAGAVYTVDTKRENGRIVAITWKQEIKPKDRAEFFFTATNPAAAGALTWKAHQQYGGPNGGTMVHWIGVEGDRRPASVTQLTPAAAGHAGH
jgi:uncharacterized protein YcnI